MPSVVAQSRLIHVDDVDEDAAICAASIGRSAGIPVTSDIERVTERTEELVAAVTIPIFAEHVIEALTGERDFERGLRKVRAQYGHDLICVTLGARGAMLLEDDRLHHAPGLPVEVVDTTGAGDVFRGAFIFAFLRGDAPADVLRFANTAAALSCTRLGAIDGMPAMEEVLGYRFSSRNPSGGTINDNDCSKPCAAIGSVIAPPPFPMLLPPYDSPSLLRTSRTSRRRGRRCDSRAAAPA